MCIQKLNSSVIMQKLRMISGQANEDWEGNVQDIQNTIHQLMLLFVTVCGTANSSDFSDGIQILRPCQNSRLIPLVSEKEAIRSVQPQTFGMETARDSDELLRVGTFVADRQKDTQVKTDRQTTRWTETLMWTNRRVRTFLSCSQMAFIFF